MIRILTFFAVAAAVAVPALRAAEPLRGTYVEARTCQVYTGPCFANGEIGSAGKDAIMTWHIKSGDLDGVELKGHSVAVIVRTSHTLALNGLNDARTRQAIVIVDSTASDAESSALQRFALSQTGLQESEVVDVFQRDIDMDFDMTDVTAKVKVEDFATIETRKARPGDCICSNERAFYPPLTELKGCVPGVTVQGDVTARRLGHRWSIPDSRTAYLGVFDVDSSSIRLATTF